MLHNAGADLAYTIRTSRLHGERLADESVAYDDLTTRRDRN